MLANASLRSAWRVAYVGIASFQVQHLVPGNPKAVSEGWLSLCVGFRPGAAAITGAG